MRILLDTHAFIWFIEGSTELSRAARSQIEDDACEKLFSVASAWEMSIKSALGRLDLGEPLSTLIPAQLELNGFTLLPVDLKHLAPLETLPQHHRDPFDRLLIAQCLAEGVTILSADASLDAYANEGLVRVW